MSSQPVPPSDPYEIVLLVASWGVVVGLAVSIVRRDEKHLDDDRRARSWPPAGRDAALIGLSLLGTPLLGLFAVVYHFFRTRSQAMWPPWRWSGRGLLLGLGWVLVILVANALVVTGLAWVLGLPMD